MADEDQTEEPEAILPPPCVVVSLTWEVEEKVRAATASQSGPGACPNNRLYIPEELRAEVLEWGHSSHVTCHPGARRTGAFL